MAWSNEINIVVGNRFVHREGKMKKRKLELVEDGKDEPLQVEPRIQGSTTFEFLAATYGE